MFEFALVAKQIWQSSSLIAEASRPLSQSREALEAPSGPTSDVRQPGGTELFAWALALVYSDHDFDARERDRLAKLTKRLGIPELEARKLQRAAQFGNLGIVKPANSAEALQWIDELEALAKVDGPLNRDERRIIEGLSMRANAEQLRS